MMIKIYNADNSYYDIGVEGLNNTSNIEVLNKVTQAIQEYYENRGFMEIENKLEDLTKGE